MKGNSPSLLGRNWLEYLHLNWKAILAISPAPELQNILQKNAEVFKEELGTLQNFKVKLYVDPKVKPRYCKARPVPYAL